MAANDSNAVLNHVLEWSQSRPDWLRDGLRRVVINGTLSEDEVNEVAQLCWKEHAEPESEKEAIPFAAEHFTTEVSGDSSYSVKSLSGTRHVNRLAPDQTLEFGARGLSIVYGQNGTGKSGYSRIFKKACRARLAKDIEPNANEPEASDGAPCSLITLTDENGGEIRCEWMQGAEADSRLSTITVFDRDCGSVHVRGDNEVWFRPFGLDIPDELASVCRGVKAILDAKKADLNLARNPIFDDPYWHPSSSFGVVLGELQRDTNLATLRDVGVLSEFDTKRLDQVRIDLANDPKKAIDAERRKAQRLRQAGQSLLHIAEQLSSDAVTRIEAEKRVAISSRAVANAAASQAFDMLPIEGVGTEVWKGLWEAARRYSESLEVKPQNFPPTVGEHCVLCHQEILDQSEQRMRSFETFVKDETETAARRDEATYAASMNAVREAQIDIRRFSEALTIARSVGNDIEKSMRRLLACLRVRRSRLLRADEESVNVLPIDKSVIAELQVQADQFEARAMELEALKDDDGREMLRHELYELEDRSRKQQLIGLAEAEVGRLQQLHIIGKCLKETNTRPITDLVTEVAREIVTPKMRDRFADEIGKIAGPKIRVELVQSRGDSGSVRYTVKLIRNPNASVQDILSEGEQTCVALASYLSELANTDHRSALIFDDPITSLDHRWRRNVAKRLVEESKHRQVIVFTHDLIFVNDLDYLAMRAKVDRTHGHLTLGPQGVGVFSSGIPWKGAKVPERLDLLEKSARAARALYDADDEEKFANEAFDIYERLRSTWERALEDLVFAGVLLRHRDYINSKHLGKVVALTEPDVEMFTAGYETCCDYIEAHDPSRGRDANPPAPDEILRDIETLKTWYADLKGRQNLHEKQKAP